MAPFDASQDKHANRIRDLLRFVIVIGLALNLVTLLSTKFLADAMAKSQLVVQDKVDKVSDKVDSVRNDVGNIKTDVHRELDAFATEGKKRLQANSDNTVISLVASMAAESASEQASKEVRDLRTELLTRMKAVEEKSTVATKATLATHAKVSQKLLTGADAEDVRRRETLADRRIKQAEKIKQDKHPTVYKIWPWQ